jgi:hypothetical protein
VVKYDPAALRKAAAAMGRAAAGLLRSAGKALASPPVLLAAAAALIAALAAWTFLPAGRKRTLRRLAAGFDARTPVGFYADFLWIMAARHGLRKAPSQTAWEFARAAVARAGGHSAAAIDFVTARYCEARYAGRAPDTAARVRIEEMLEQLRRINES